MPGRDALGRAIPSMVPLGTNRTRKSWFSSARCNGCIYKRTFYCWRSCYFNVWKTKRNY